MKNSPLTGQSVKVSDKPNSATRQVQAVPDSRYHYYYSYHSSFSRTSVAPPSIPSLISPTEAYFTKSQDKNVAFFEKIQKT